MEAGLAAADLLLTLLVEVPHLDRDVVQLGLGQRVEDVARGLGRLDRVDHVEGLPHGLGGLARDAVDGGDERPDPVLVDELGLLVDQLVGHGPFHERLADVGVAGVDAHEQHRTVGGGHGLHEAGLDGRRVAEAVPGQPDLVLVDLAELLDPQHVGREVVVVERHERRVVGAEVLLQLLHHVGDGPLAQEVALPVEDLALVVDVAERALERAAAAGEHLEHVAERARLPPELLLREGEDVEVVLEHPDLVAVDHAVLLDPHGRDVRVVLAA